MTTAIHRLALDIVQGAARYSCTLRLIGGIAVAERCQAVYTYSPELARVPNDIDLVGLSCERFRIETLFERLGFIANREFNLLSGADRLLYSASDPRGDPVRVDVVLDRLEMCHVLELSQRLDRHSTTVSATDLLLSKLQVIFPSERDAKDTLALLATFDFQPTGVEADHIELRYICRICCSEWGWHHTITMNLQRVEAWLDLIKDSYIRSLIRERAHAIMAALEDCPKTLRWRLRNAMGERLRWYQVPEEMLAE